MGKIIQIKPDRIRASQIHQVSGVIKGGGVILYPTDTIYGLGCAAFDIHAVRRIFELKKRSLKNPALVLVRNFTMMKKLVDGIPPQALELIRRFWPGPLTLIFKARKNFNPLLVSEENKIGIRIPDNRFCLKLMGDCKLPIVSTSANISGKEGNARIGVLKEIFINKVDLIIDAGDIKKLVPSTVIDISDGKIGLVREGVIPLKKILGHAKDYMEEI